jgi:aminomethyltransferase
MVDFHGWSMPINYGSQINEHNSVRENCGIFDVSHMTILDFKGDDAETFVRKLISNDIKKLTEPYAGLYSAMVNEQGGVIDDLIAYKMENGYRLVVNCATRGEDLKWISSKSLNFKVEMTERDDLSMIAVQGPRSLDVLSSCPAPIVRALESKKRQQGVYGNNMFATKTGYTGEIGFEVILPHEQAVNLWQNAIDAGAVPVGLGARDTLRLEAGMNLYGFEMDEFITPFECNMSWTVDFSDTDRDFYGKKALENILKEENYNELVGIMLDERTILRQGQKLWFNENKDLDGIVTSGTYSPTLKKPIALARIPKADLKSCFTEVRDKKVFAKIGSPKFIKEGKEIFKERL